MKAPEIIGEDDEGNGFNFAADVCHTPKLIEWLRREIPRFEVHVGQGGTTTLPDYDMFWIREGVSRTMLCEIVGQFYERL